MQNTRFIQQTKTSRTSKKQTRKTVERRFLNLIFLNFLNVRKDYQIPQQFALKPPAENDTVRLKNPPPFL